MSTTKSPSNNETTAPSAPISTRSGSVVGPECPPSIRSSTSDHGRTATTTSHKKSSSSEQHSTVDSGFISSGGASSSAATADSTGSPSQIRRRYHSMNDMRNAGFGGSLPVSSSLGSFAGAANREAAPPVDPNALPDMLNRTQRLADSLANSIEKVAVQLRTMAKLTVENLNVVDDTAASSCESAESLVKTLYSLMSKYDEMRKELYIIPTVSQQLKEIERLLDVLEMHANQAEARMKPQ